MRGSAATCDIADVVLNWQDHISHLYYDQDEEMVRVAASLLASLNAGTGSQYKIIHVQWWN